MQHACNTHATYMQHTCNIHATYMQHTCNIHAADMQISASIIQPVVYIHPTAPSIDAAHNRCASCCGRYTAGNTHAACMYAAAPRRSASPIEHPAARPTCQQQSSSLCCRCTRCPSPWYARSRRTTRAAPDCGCVHECTCVCTKRVFVRVYPHTEYVHLRSGVHLHACMEAFACVYASVLMRVHGHSP